MSWDRTNGIMRAPVGNGDISQAVHNTSLDLGYLIRNGLINPMARRKPVRHASQGVLDEAAFASTRYGFGGQNIVTLGGNFEAVWEYLRPRGIHGTADNPGTTSADDEWYRALDFDGYSENAVAPLKVENMGCTVGDEVYSAVTGELSMLLYTNSYITGWNATDCIKFREFIQGGSSFWNYYCAFLFIDMDGSEKNFVVTDKKLSDVYTSDDMQYGFAFSQIEQTSSGLTMPAVPILNRRNLGHNIKCIYCLCSSGASSPYLYNVYTESSSPTASQMGAQAYSLAFVQGCDRDTAIMRNRVSMAGATGSITTFTAQTGSTTYPIDQEHQIIAYKVFYTAEATIDTTGCTTRWPYDACTVKMVIRMHHVNYSGSQGEYMSSDGDPNNHTYTGVGVDEIGAYYEYEVDERLWNNTSRVYSITFNADFPWIVKQGTTAATAKFRLSVLLRQYGETDINLGNSVEVTVTA